jgi:hypothetical protein
VKRLPFYGNHACLPARPKARQINQRYSLDGGTLGPHNLGVQHSKQIIPYFNSFVLPILSIVTKYLILKGYSLVIDNKGEGQ